MRGKVTFASALHKGHRITPAYAGKRVRCSQQALPCTDYPRMCGEKRQDRLDYYVPQGSPPHVRGKGFFHFTHEMFEGITPACAGKSWNLEQVVYGPGDHPRVCGEKSLCKMSHVTP